MHNNEPFEDPGVEIDDDLGQLDDETLRRLAEEHGIEMPDWQPTIPGRPLNVDPEEQAKLEEMAEAAERMIAAAQNDPTQQQYFKRLDKNTIVQSEAEFHYCQNQFIPMKMVSYSAAVTCVQQEEAKVRAKRARRKANKRARASRKANRR